MYELVEVKKDEVFTTSKVIADGTNVKHEAVQKLIQKYENHISRFGAVGFEIRVLKHQTYKGSTSEKVYILNEQQATLLMMLMRNDGVDGIVVEFKARLTEEFFRMRDFIRQKQSSEWVATRQANKETREDVCRETRMRQTVSDKIAQQKFGIGFKML